MYRYLPTVALVVGVVLLAILGAKRAADPQGATSAEPQAERPREPAVVVPATTKPRPRRVIRFERGPDEPKAPVTSVVVAADTPPPPPPGRRSLDELSEAQLQEVRGLAMERLEDLVEACEGTLSEPTQSMASIVLDDRGLHTMELASYEGGPGEPVVMLTEPPPPALADCLEDELWAGDWAVMQPGESVAFELTMRFEPDEEGAAPE